MIKFLMALSIFLSSNTVFAVCDFATDIKENANGSYNYSRECHIETGRAFKNVSLLGEKITLLEKKLEFKDIMITKYEQRSELWMETSYKMNDKLMAYEATKSNDKWISFALGMGLAFVSIWAAGQLSAK